jgi:hypothetical protein
MIENITLLFKSLKILKIKNHGYYVSYSLSVSVSVSGVSSRYQSDIILISS